MKNILEELINMREESYKEFSKKLCPDTNKEILGIRVPALRKFAQKIIKDNTYNWDEFVQNNNIKYFEEIMLQGLLVGYSNLEFEEKLKYMKLIIPRIDSWAMTDTIIPTLKVKEKDLEKYWKFILYYLYSDKEFEIRYAVISILDYFIVDKYIDEVIKKLDGISHEGYYVKMAVAWTLAEIGIKYNNKAMIFLKEHNNLDKFTYNKTLQKMIESYRVSKEQKDILRSMKRK